MPFMPKSKISFQTKLLLLVFVSMVFAGVVTYALFAFMQYYYHHYVFLNDPLASIRLALGNVGLFIIFALFYMLFTLVFFKILISPISSYFKQISHGLKQLANSHFQYETKISTNDEFSQLAHDVNTASLKLKEAIERGDFAESSRDQLIVNLAHDLRTPLTSVIGYLDIIKNETTLNEEQKQHYTNIAHKKARRLEELIDHLFDITKLNYGKLSITKSEINLSELLLQLSEEMYPVLKKNHLETRLQLQPALMIEADGRQLARVFENLLNNAIRYGVDGQFIDIRSSLGDDEAIVQIINYGDDIREEDLPYIFDSFYTSDPSRAHQEGGTGLGLFIAKNIVEQHGGRISVDSTVIQTSFEIRLPVHQPTTENKT